MKLKRKSGLTAGIIALSAVAITSVGFASWVISAGDTETITGDIKVDTVTDGSKEIVGVYDKGATTKISTKSSKNVQFGAPTSNNAYGWLTYSSTGTGSTAYQENLEFTFYFQAKTDFDVDCVKVGISVDDPESPDMYKIQDGSFVQHASGTYGGFAGARTLNLVDIPSEVSVSKVTGSALNTLTGSITDEATEDATYSWFKVDFTFLWGSKFDYTVSDWAASHKYLVGQSVTSGTKNYVCTTEHTSGASFDSTKWVEFTPNNNPYYYYNSMLSTKKIDDTGKLGAEVAASRHASEYLGVLENLLADVEFKLEIHTYATASERSADTEFVDVTGVRRVSVYSAE